MNYKLLYGLITRDQNKGDNRNHYLYQLMRKLTNSNCDIVRLPKTYGYTGEFFERHVERGDYTDRGDFEALAAYYAMLKARMTDIPTDIFNEYQLSLVEKEAVENYFVSPVYAVAMLLITGEKKYLSDLHSCEATRDFNVMQTILLMIRFANDDKISSEDFNIISYIQWSLSTTYVLEKSREFFDTIYFLYNMRVDENKDFTKEFPLLSIYVKALYGNIKSKKDLALLKSIGFTDLNLVELDFILKYNSPETSNVKTSRTIVSMLTTLCTTSDAWNDADLAIIRQILNIRGLPAKLDGGTITNVREIVTMYDLVKKVDVKNFNAFASLLVSTNIVDYTSLLIDFTKDPLYREKLSSLTLERKNNIIVQNFEHSVINEEKNIPIAVERLLSFDGISSVEEIYDTYSDSEFRGKARYRSSFSEIVDNYDYIDIVAFARRTTEKDVINDYLLDWLRNTSSVKKIYVMREVKLSIANLVRYDWYTYLVPATSSSFVPNGTKEEKREYLERLFQIALEEDLQTFRKLFINMMLMDKEVLTDLYSPEELRNLYEIGLGLARQLPENAYYREFARDNVLKRLNETYMTDEEKERLAEEARKAEEARIAEEVRRKESNVRANIEANTRKYISNCNFARKPVTPFGLYYFVYREMSYYDTKSTAAKEFFKTQLAKVDVVYKNEVANFFEAIGNVVENDILSMDTAKQIISNVTLLEASSYDVIDNDNDNAECA